MLFPENTLRYTKSRGYNLGLNKGLAISIELRRWFRHSQTWAI